jgi:hypothetical protein
MMTEEQAKKAQPWIKYIIGCDEETLDPIFSSEIPNDIREKYDRYVKSLKKPVMRSKV